VRALRLPEESGAPFGRASLAYALDKQGKQGAELFLWISSIMQNAPAIPEAGASGLGQGIALAGQALRFAQDRRAKEN
jgi:hypothetical protein